MTAIVGLGRASGGSSTSHALAGVTLALLLNCIFPTQALAQVGGSIGLDSDYRLRGASLTGGDPAVTGQLTYDDPSGIYLNLAAVARFGAGNAQFMGVIGNVGYARRLNNHVTLDGGVIRSQIRSVDALERPYHYTEFYAGASIGRVVGRVYYSPDYRRHGVSTIYGELETGFEPGRDWRVSGHVGVMTYLDPPPYQASGTKRPDWRVSVSKQFGRLEAHAALSGGGPGKSYYDFQRYNKPVVTAGASISF